MGGVEVKTLLTSFLFTLSVLAQSDEQIASAIYRLEGGTKAKSPYGILSVKVRSTEHARQVCLTTIRNNRARWIKAGAKGDYLDFLADRYCPPSVDAVGNRNWKKNIHKLLK
jgi:hypothetical protein